LVIVNIRLAVDMDMDIHGYIHVWILDFSHPVDISMDIMLPHLVIKLNTYMLCFYNIFLSVVFTLHFSFICAVESNSNTNDISTSLFS